MKKPNVTWCVADMAKHVLRCARCGEEVPDGLPMDLRKFCERLDGFMVMHRSCRPKNDPTSSVDQ